MDELTQIIKKIRDLPQARVDNNYGQGYDAVLNQLRRDYEPKEAELEANIEEARNIVSVLQQDASPYEVPENYIRFLELYGGLAINGNDYYFATHGIGPMSEVWYSSLISPEAQRELVSQGFLAVGSLSFRGREYAGQSVEFYIDLAGRIAGHCVIGVGPSKWQVLSPSTVILNAQDYPDLWHYLAPSFARWLEQAAETHGAFTYL